MAINQNHTVEEIGGIRCSVVERNIDVERIKFVKELLESNGFTCIVGDSENELFNIGVTSLDFNLTHTLYARKLHNLDGRIITPAFWKSKSWNTGFYWEQR